MFDRRRFLRAAGALGLAGSLTAVVGSGGGDAGADPRVLVAGSLLALADAVPGGRVEAHGSLAVRRLVLEGARDPDVVALADPGLFAGLAEETTLFATNALVVAYDPDSPWAAAVRDDWRAAFEGGPRLGRTDPARDPLGYRTLLALALARRRGAVADEPLANSVVLPETELLPTLAGGELDAAVAYRNMATEHGVPAVELPDELDFSAPTLADHYRSAAVRVDGRRLRSGPIRYGVHARTDRGRAWVDRLLAGRDRLRDRGFGVPDAYPRRVDVASVPVPVAD